MSKELVKLRNIHKWFGGIHALNGVNFQIKKGEIVGLIGENGAGKSTLVKVLTGVYHPDMGEIFFHGKKVAFSSPKQARENGIETIYQEQALAGDLSIKRNIFLGKEITKKIGFINVLDFKKMSKITEKIVHSLGLKGISSVDQLAKHCSGGERQGIAIGRAMYFKADLVILDEPTRALGIKGRKRVLEFVKGMKKKGIASIYITHTLEYLFDIADRFIILKNGEVTADKQKKDTSIDELYDHMF